MRKSRPYIFYGQTTSLCDACLKLVPAKICIQGDDVFYEKRCQEHGKKRVKVSSDAAFFRWQRDFLKPGDQPLTFQSRTLYGCPYDCGLCPDHEQHSCLAIIEINEECNLQCPVCFASSSPARKQHRSLPEIDRMLDALVKSEGEPDVVQLSGGEPTLHPQFFDVLDLARSKPIRHIMINTNGVRIAEDEEFVKSLARRGRGLEIYLQFDSLQRDALMALRGADLRRIRSQALENLEKHNVSTTLVCVVKKGINDEEIGPIISHALRWRCVRGVNFQPIQDAGRNENYIEDRDRVLLSDIRKKVIKDSGVFGEMDMIPLPCNPSAITIGYGLRNGEKVVPVTSLIDPRELLPSVPNAITFEKYPELQRRIYDLFSLSTGPDSAVSRLSELLCCLPQFPLPEGLTYENVFRISVIDFMDAHNFCIANVKRSCVHFVLGSGQIIPFETYNLFYRSGHLSTRANLTTASV